MPPNAEVAAWWHKAEEDWLCVQRLLDGDVPLVVPALFHLQQACEKCLKTVYLLRGESPPKTHDLGLMVENLAIEEPRLLCHLELVEALNPFAVQYRYPGDLPEVSIKEATDLVKRSLELKKWVEEKIFES